MPKIDVNKVAEILKNNEVDPKLLRQIVEEMNLLARAEANEEKAPAVAKQFAILISDPDGLLPSTDFAGWVLQVPEDESVATMQDRALKAIYEYNASRKGRLNPAKTLGEAFEYIPGKFFKEAGLWVKTRTPVLMLRTDNEVPKAEPTEKLDYSVRVNGKTVFDTAAERVEARV
jgi:hypothetical protein